MSIATVGSSSMIDILPPDLQRAQCAIAKPEVIAMMKALADYGLGVCMPHAHAETASGFAALPLGMVSVERNQTVTFEPTDAAASGTRIPVAWRYETDANGVACVAECGCCHFDPATQSHNRP